VLSFCFEGARWQFFSPVDLAFRVALGSLSAVAISGRRMPAFAGATTLCGCFFAATLFHAPYVCFSENVVLLLLQLGLTICALAHLGHAAGTFDPEVCNGFVLLSIACGIPGCFFVALRTLVVLLAACCGNRCCCQGQRRRWLHDESVEFEERAQSRCNVDLTLRGPRDAWLLTVPAACYISVTDHFIHVQENRDGSPDIYAEESLVANARPRLEFPVLDYLASVDVLEPPRVVIFGPSQTEAGFSLLGYRSEVIYADEDFQNITYTFVEQSIGTELAQMVTQKAMQIIERCCDPQKIVVIELVAPLHSEDHGSSSDGETDGLLAADRMLKVAN